MFLLAETDLILDKKGYKKNISKFFCSNSCKIVFALLTKIVIGYLIITLINIKKIYFTRLHTELFCSYKSCFYYYSNNIFYVFFYINFW